MNSAGNVTVEFAQVVGLSLEFLLFGFYACLFLVSLLIIHRQRRPLTLPSKIFLCCNIIMFLDTALYTGIGIRRLIEGFILDPKGPASYFGRPGDAAHWENLITYILSTLMVTMGDSLLAYRCFIIWGGNTLAIALPTLLIVVASGVHISMFIAYTHPEIIPYSSFRQFFKAIYPLHFSQNIITTGLIATRLWHQHRESRRAGVRKLGTSLVQVLRIMLESAMIYTTQLLALIILDSQDSQFEYVLQYTSIPSIGISYNLIAVRVYMAQSVTTSRIVPPTSILPRFSSDGTVRPDIRDVDSAEKSQERSDGP